MKTELKLLVKPFILTLSLTLTVLSLHLGWWGNYTEADLLKALFRHHWSVAWPALVLIATLYTAVGGPRQVLAFSCGYLLGGWWGALVSTAIALLGAFVTISVVRHAAFGWVRERYARKVEQLRELMAQDTWVWICVIRLMPLGNNLATNIAAGLSGLSRRSVLTGSGIGYLPQMLIFSFAGSGVALKAHSQLWISVGLLLASTALAIYLYHHGFKQRLTALRGNRLTAPGDEDQF